MVRKNRKNILIMSISIAIIALFLGASVNPALAADLLDDRKIVRLEELRAARAEEDENSAETAAPKPDLVAIAEPEKAEPVLVAASTEIRVVAEEEKPDASSIKEASDISCALCASEAEADALAAKYDRAFSDLISALSILSDEQLEVFIDMFDEIDVDGVTESYMQLSKIEKVGANNFMAAKLDRLLPNIEDENLKAALMKTASSLRDQSISLRHQAEIQQFVAAEEGGLIIAGAFEIGGAGAVAVSTVQTITSSQSASCGGQAMDCDSQKDQQESICQNAFETTRDNILASIQDQPLLVSVVNGFLNVASAGPITQAVVYAYIAINFPWLSLLVAAGYLDGILAALNSCGDTLIECMKAAYNYWQDCISGEGP